MALAEQRTHQRLALAPEPPGLPLLGQSLNLVIDPLAYLVEQYQTLGPIFKVQMGLQRYVVLAGLDANRFLAKNDGVLLESYTLFGGFARYANTDVMLTALDGSEHRFMRKLMRAGFARSQAATHMPALLAIVAKHARRWQPGQQLNVLEMMRRIVVDQLAITSTNMPAADYYDDIVYYLHVLLNTEVLRTRPKWWRQNPRFRRARRRLAMLADHVLTWHRENPPATSGRPRDLIDDVLASPRPDGQPFTHDDLVSIAIGPYFAGVDTLASTLAFYLLAILRDPSLTAAVQSEVDALFERGFDMKDLRSLSLLHAAGVETLRRYPVTPFTPRVAAENFYLGGYEIPAGTELMFAQTVTHMLPEFYEEPEEFRPERFLGSNRKRMTNVFTPFTVGAHTCLGAGLAEAQMLLTLAGLLRHVAFAPVAAQRPLKIHATPLPNPGPKTTVRVQGLR